MIFVLDHNVVISALLKPSGVPANLLELVLSSHIVVTTHQLLLELDEVASRKKFDRYFSSEARKEFVSSYAARCRVLEVSDQISECRDPNDDKLLALALLSRADFLISGDVHLLEMHPWRSIPILTPQQFFALRPTNDLP